MVYALRKVENDLFCAFFHLWGNGGPNWIREHKLWESECLAEWTVVSRSKFKHQSSGSSILDPHPAASSSRKSFAEVVKSRSPHLVPAPLVFKRIKQALVPLARPSRQADPQRKLRPDHVRPSQFRRSGLPFSNLRNRNFRGGISCFKCLAVGHIAQFCRNDFRCRFCSGYGHIQRDCLARIRRRKIYRPVSNSVRLPSGLGPPKPISVDESDLSALSPRAGLVPITFPSSPRSPSIPLPPFSSPPAIILPECLAPETLANYKVDPSIFLPRGFSVGSSLFPDRRPKRLRSHLGTERHRSNEEVGIAVLVPPVAACDFGIMADALHHYLVQSFRVRVSEVAACPIGAAFVTFGSCVEREAAIAHSPHPFEPYSLSFVKHDESINLRYAPLGRVCWIMLVVFPLDCYNVAAIGRAVAGFGTLVHWHESSNKARILIKVLVPSADVVPESILVVIGNEPGAKEWDIPCFILQEDSALQPPDEDPLPPFGVAAHPQLPPRPRWLGFQPARPQVPGDDRPDGAPAAAASVLGDLSVADAQEVNEVDQSVKVLPLGDHLPVLSPGSVGVQATLLVILEVNVGSVLEGGVPDLPLCYPQLGEFQLFFNCLTTFLELLQALDPVHVSVLDLSWHSVVVNDGLCQLQFFVSVVTQPRVPNVACALQ